MVVTDDIIVWFWRLVGGLQQEERALLLKFSTGSPNVPAGGFSQLQGLSGPTSFTIALVPGSNKVRNAWAYTYTWIHIRGVHRWVKYGKISILWWPLLKLNNLKRKKFEIEVIIKCLAFCTNLDVTNKLIVVCIIFFHHILCILYNPPLLVSCMCVLHRFLKPPLASISSNWLTILVNRSYGTKYL